MTDKERVDLQIKIEETIHETEKRVADLKELTKPIPPENAIGRVSRMDAINNKSVNEAALRREEGKLSKLNYALTKINDPSFGICISCKGTIQPLRLMLLPESQKCVKCAR